MENKLRSLVCSIPLILYTNGIGYSQSCDCNGMYGELSEVKRCLEIAQDIRNSSIERLQENPENQLHERDLYISLIAKYQLMKERSDLLRRLKECKCEKIPL